jgi:nucleoside-diphosphate-sugar epimerase
MTERLRVLLAGCGYVGTALGLSLAQAGHEVFALSRNPARLPSEFHRLRADLTDARTLEHLPAGLDFAVFSATPAEASDEAYQRTYVQGLSHLLQALADHAATRRVFFTSSTAVYAQNDGGWVDERSPTEPSHFTGRRTLEAELVAASGVVPATVLRCAGIYGPGRTRLVDSVREGTLRLPAEDHFTNRIHRDDVAGAVHYFIDHGTQADCVILSDDRPAPYSEVVTWLAQRLGVPVPKVDPAAPPRSRGGNKRCQNRKLHELGYALRYPSYEQGYGAMLSQGQATH